MKKAVEFIVACMNFDGGFGCVPGSESHSGQVSSCEVTQKPLQYFDLYWPLNPARAMRNIFNPAT